MRRFSILLVSVLLACGGDSPAAPPEPGPPVALSVVAGDLQVDTVTRELTDAVLVEVTDAEALAVPGVLVNFVVVEGGGSVFAGSALTNGSGRAREIWTLGPDAGEQVLEARAVDQDTGEPIVYARITATAMPDRPADINISDRSAVLFIAEKMRVPTVSAYDAHGNPIADPVISWETAEGVQFFADSVWADAEVRGQLRPALVGQDDAAEVDALELLVVRDLRTMGWTVEYACIAAWRADKDSISVSLQVDSMTYAPAADQLARELTWWLSGEAVQWYADGSSETLTITPTNGVGDGVTRTRMFMAQDRPGGLGWNWPAANLATEGVEPAVYSGGTWCPAEDWDTAPLGWTEREVVIAGRSP